MLLLFSSSVFTNLTADVLLEGFTSNQLNYGYLDKMMMGYLLLIGPSFLRVNSCILLYIGYIIL